MILKNAIPQSTTKPFRVNLGSGSKRIPGFLNVDLYDPTADIKQDLRSIVFDRDTIADAVCYHAIEHLCSIDAIRLIRAVQFGLIVGGTFAVETPDYKKCARLIRNGVTHKKGSIVVNTGAAGIVGGRPPSVDQKRFHEWLHNNADKIAQQGPMVGIPQEFFAEGAEHCSLWSEGELLELMSIRGRFVTHAEAPQTHGRRKQRDCRVVMTRIA